MIDIGTEMQTFILVFFRIVSMLWLLPIFRTGAISVTYKAGLSLIIAFLLFPYVSPPQIGGDSYLLFIAIAREVLIGLSVSFFVNVLFSMVTAAGEIMSMQSGLSFARSMDPALMTNLSVLEHFKSLLGILIFLGIDGHHVILRSLSSSFKEIPPGAALVKPSLFQYMINSTSSLFGASLKIAAPVIVTLFLVEIALGILARMIPQVNVLVEGASMKILIAFFMLIISLNLIAPVIASLFKNMDVEILRIMKCMV